MLIPEIRVSKQSSDLCHSPYLAAVYSNWSNHTEKRFRFPTSLSDILLTTDSAKGAKVRRTCVVCQRHNSFFTNIPTGRWHYTESLRNTNSGISCWAWAGWPCALRLDDRAPSRTVLLHPPKVNMQMGIESILSSPSWCHGLLSKAAARQYKSGCESWQWCLWVNAAVVNQ